MLHVTPTSKSINLSGALGITEKAENWTISCKRCYEINIIKGNRREEKQTLKNKQLVARK